MTTQPIHPDAATLAAWLDPEASPGEAERDHVAGCDACQTVLQDHRRIQALLQASLAVHVPRSFAIPAADPAPARRSGLPLVWLRAITTVAGTAMLLFIGLDLAIVPGPAISTPPAVPVTLSAPDARADLRSSPQEAAGGQTPSPATAPGSAFPGPAGPAAGGAAGTEAGGEPSGAEPAPPAAMARDGIPVVRLLAMIAGAITGVGALAILRQRYRQSTGR